MAKTFTQCYTDAGLECNNSSSGNLTFLKSKINECIHKALALRDWTFNKRTYDDLTVASQQGYSVQYNVQKIDYVYVYVGSVWYVPIEIKTEEEWRILNRVTVTSDIPIYWHYDEVNRKVELYPVPATASNTIRYGFTHKIKDLGATSYTTGTVSTALGSTTLTGILTVFTASMAGRSIKITDTDTVLDGMWFEIASYTSGTVLVLKEEAPAAVSGKSFTIDELIPFPDGYEDMAQNYAVAKYYLKRRRKDMAQPYLDAYNEALKDLISTDSKTQNDLLVKQKPLGVIDVNKDAWALSGSLS